MQGHTWFDITHGLPSARNFITGGGFRVGYADVLVLLLRRNVGLDDARGNCKIGRLLGDALGKATSVPPN